MLKIVRLTLVCLFALSLGTPALAYAQSPTTSWPPFCQEGSLPSHDPQYPDDQLIIVCVPPPPYWNGQLVVYAHGYVPPQAPRALPVDELTLPDGTFVPGLVLAQGYAFATSSYHKNGYAVRLSMHTTADDPTKYRTEEEVQRWERRDPILRLRRHLENQGLWDEAREQRLRDDVKQLIDDEVRRYETMKDLPAAAAFDHVFSTPPASLAPQRAEFESRATGGPRHG